MAGVYAAFLDTNVTSKIVNYNKRPGVSSGYSQNDDLVPGLYDEFGNPNGNGDTDFAMEITAWLDLAAGVYRFGGLTDDGFKCSSGSGLHDLSPGALLHFWNGGPADRPERGEFEFVVFERGLYPFRFMWYERQGAAYAEWFSVNRTTGERILINDTDSPAAIKAFTSVSAPPTGVTILNPRFEPNGFVLSFQSETGKMYTVQSSPDLNSWGSSGVAPVPGNGGLLNISIPTQTGSKAFYRVQTQ